jgi:hypothetical protein
MKQHVRLCNTSGSATLAIPLHIILHCHASCHHQVMSSQSCHDLLASNALDKPADIGMQMWRAVVT